MKASMGGPVAVKYIVAEGTHNDEAAFMQKVMAEVATMEGETFIICMFSQFGFIGIICIKIIKPNDP